MANGLGHAIRHLFRLSSKIKASQRLQDCMLYFASKSFVLDPDSAAAAGFRLQSHTTSNALYPFAYERETNTSACITFVRMQPLKHSKDFTLIFRRNADAVFRDPNPDPILPLFRPYGYFGPDTGLYKLQCVRNQIG